MEGHEHFMAKRFHTANTIKDTMVVTFGGCHSEYHHINDLNLFDLTAFLENPKVNKVICTKITQTKNVPSTRWGHGAAVYENSKLLILGGRNDNDISDLH